MLVNEDITTLNNGYKLIQKKDGFRFSVDAVILSDFFSPTKKGKILDIGCGNGIIPILLYSKGKGEDITGVEIQEENCELALKNVKLNNYRLWKWNHSYSPIFKGKGRGHNRGRDTRGKL